MGWVRISRSSGVSGSMELEVELESELSRRIPLSLMFIYNHLIDKAG